MKTYHASRTSQINRERYGKGLLTAVLVVAGICAFVHQGFTQDLKSFAQAESYLADGQLTTLTRNWARPSSSSIPA